MDRSRIERVKDSTLLRQWWDAVFATKDPFGIPFRELITSYMVFFETAGYHLERNQYDALVGAAKSIEDRGFLLSEVEWAGDFFAKGSHWWCEFPRYEDYIAKGLGIENAMYSRRGEGGILISHELH